MDMLTGSTVEYGGGLIFYENIGTAETPEFDGVEANPFNIQANGYVFFPTFVDLDADGDMDLLMGGFYEDENDYSSPLKYYENIGTAEEPNFDAPQTNPFGLTSTYYFSTPAFADLDKDGDMDLFVGEYYGTVQYFENIGTAEEPNFAAPVANAFGFLPANEYTVFPAFADLDADGDTDLLMGDYETASFHYYENTTPVVNVGIENEAVFETTCTIFPNPTADFVQVKTKEQIAKVEISDVSGKNLGTYTDISRPISLKHLAKGLYSLKIVNNDGAFVTKMVQKQ